MGTEAGVDSKKGWWVVFGSFCALTVTSGVAFFSIPVLLESIMVDTGWSLTQVSLGMTIWGGAAALFSPFCGHAIDKFGVRRMMLFGTILAVTTTFLLGRVTALWQFYVIMAIAPIGMMSNTYIPVATVITHWFVKHRGIATGLAMLGLGVGGAAFPIMTSTLLDEHSWQETFTYLALFLSAALFPIFIWVRSPSEADMAHVDAAEGDLHEVDAASDLTLATALKTRSFWGLSLGDMLTGLVFAIFNIHLVYYLTQDLGDDKIATQVYSALQMCIGLGVLVFGPLGDRFNFRHVIVLCYFLPALATGILLSSTALFAAFAFAIVAGLAGGGRSALFPVAIHNSFGGSHIAAIYGLSNTFFMIGNAVGPLIAAALYDRTGNTRAVYFGAMAVLAFSAFLLSLIRDERNRGQASIH